MDTSDAGVFAGIFSRGPVSVGSAAWLRAMLDTEAALARALERAGLAEPGAGAAVTSVAQAGHFDPADLGRRAASAGNPVPALVRALTSQVSERSPAAAQSVHRGATSQDIIDTAMMLLSRQVIDAVQEDLRVSAGRTAALTRANGGTIMAGRTLLQQAVPVTFAAVTAGWLSALDEARLGLHRIRTRRLAVQFGGAAGTLAALGEHGPAVAEILADELRLPVPDLPWHTNRLRVIELAAALAGTCAVLAKIARDVTLLSASEVAEVREGGDDGQRGGSSTMPHKRNPVAAVAILGCAKRAPGLLATITAAAEQEHQRAAGAWHAEWETLGELLRLTGSAAAWAAEMLTRLRADPARMLANVNAAKGMMLAESLATLLAPVLGRLTAHDLVASAATEASSEDIGLAEAVSDLADAETSARLAAAGLDRDRLEAALDPRTYLGASGHFARRALAAHEACDARFAAGSP